MNKSLIKFLTDFGPLIIFFYYYYDSDKDLKIAIPPFIIATIVALIIMWILEKKIPEDYHSASKSILRVCAFTYVIASLTSIL